MNDGTKISRIDKLGLEKNKRGIYVTKRSQRIFETRQIEIFINIEQFNSLSILVNLDINNLNNLLSNNDRVVSYRWQNCNKIHVSTRIRINDIGIN